MHMRDVVIVSAARTALGRVGGSLKTVQPEELAKIVILAAVERAGVEPGWRRSRQGSRSRCRPTR
jgi:acetyl-CoA acetyltransferase